MNAMSNMEDLISSYQNPDTKLSENPVPAPAAKS